MTKYKEIEDIIIFGSYVKDKIKPQDIDVAVVCGKRDLSLLGKISSGLPKDIHIESLLPKQIYTTHLGLSIISEGFSIKENKFLRDMVGINPYKIYSYDLKKLSPSKKRKFNRALSMNLDKLKGKRLGAGSIMIPMEKTSLFEEFLNMWDLNLDSRKYNVW